MQKIMMGNNNERKKVERAREASSAPLRKRRRRRRCRRSRESATSKIEPSFVSRVAVEALLGNVGATKTGTNQKILPEPFCVPFVSVFFESKAFHT